jgi:hypothetical protein
MGGVCWGCNYIVHLTVPTPTPNHGVQTTLALSDSCADASRRAWPRGPDTQACRRASSTPLYVWMNRRMEGWEGGWMDGWVLRGQRPQGLRASQ